MSVLVQMCDVCDINYVIYSLIDEGFDQYKQGKVKPIKESIKFIRTRLNQYGRRDWKNILRANEIK